MGYVMCRALKSRERLMGGKGPNFSGGCVVEDVSTQRGGRRRAFVIVRFNFATVTQRMFLVHSSCVMGYGTDVHGAFSFCNGMERVHCCMFIYHRMTALSRCKPPQRDKPCGVFDPIALWAPWTTP